MFISYYIVDNHIVKNEASQVSKFLKTNLYAIVENKLRTFLWKANKLPDVKQ